MPTIPYHLTAANARFCKVRRNEKIACETGWQSKPYMAGDLIQWLAAGNNYGILCLNGVCSLDVDDPEAFKATGIQFPPTFLDRRQDSETGYLRYHAYFRCNDVPEEYRTKHTTAWGDVRLGGNFYVVGPTCVSPTSTTPPKLLTYEIVRDVPLAVVPFAVVKDLLAPAKSTQMREPSKAAPKAGGFTLPKEINGNRNITLAGAAGWMRRGGFEQEEIFNALVLANQRRCTPPLDDDELMRIVTSVCKYKAGYFGQRREDPIREEAKRMLDTCIRRGMKKPDKIEVMDPRDIIERCRDFETRVLGAA